MAGHNDGKFHRLSNQGNDLLVRSSLVPMSGHDILDNVYTFNFGDRVISGNINYFRSYQIHELLMDDPEGYSENNGKWSCDSNPWDDEYILNSEIRELEFDVKFITVKIIMDIDNLNCYEFRSLIREIEANKFVFLSVIGNEKSGEKIGTGQFFNEIHSSIRSHYDYITIGFYPVKLGG